MSENSWAVVSQRVHERANYCCEYCQTCQQVIGQAFHVDHIHPDGNNELENLCLACPTCNLSKAKATTGIDPETTETVSLFHPRTQQWHDHFEWIDRGIRVHGLTPVGRATVERLKMNQDRVVNARALWVQANYHPPKS